MVILLSYRDSSEKNLVNTTQTARYRRIAGVAAAFAALSSYAQRRLSSPVRRVRRQVTAVSGTIDLKDGSREPLTRETLIAGSEAALRALTAAVIALAVALVVLRVS